MGIANGKIEQEDLEKVVSLHKEYDEIKGGNKRISVKDFEKRVRGECEKSNRMSELDKKVVRVREMFSNKKSIEFMDFLRWKIEFMQGNDTDELRRVLEQVFAEIDDGDGFLDPKELVTLEEKLGNFITEEEAAILIKEWDHDGDGKMDLDNFVTYKFANLSS